jgi:hypothetical protein
VVANTNKKTNKKDMIMKRTFLLFSLLSFLALPLSALVKYDEGRLMINGIQFLQDKDDALAYYYLPQYPKLSVKEDGSFELLFLKYIGQGGAETNGGIFHALVEFTLPDDLLQALTTEIKKIVPGARIVGPVPLLQTMKDGEIGMAAFKVVSSVLSNVEGENRFTQTIITSGHAPLLPGSKAAIAAKLSQEGATLLWESLRGPTSDVSVSINGYYEAYVKGYNAIVTADASTVYEHYSRILNKQQGYDRKQLRKISDELVQDQSLKVDVFDRSAALNIKADDLQAILDIVTNKLIELMFDTETGWARIPPTETAVEQDQIKGRQERGWFSKVFGGAQDEKYVTDNQFVLKKREDIRTNKFYLNLSKATSIKVPVYTTGNLGGSFFSAVGSQPDNAYFRTVNLDDPVFQKRDVIFQIDGNFAESFTDILNFVTVSFRKTFGENQNDVTSDLVFKKEDLEKGKSMQTVTYPRLGVEGSEWLNYDYRLSWSFKGNEKTIQVPRVADQWLTGSSPAVSLIPPFEKRVVTVDADRNYFKDAGIRSATVRFFVILNGKAQPQRNSILRADDTESSSRIALYYDKGEPAIYQVTWYTKEKIKKMDPVQLTDDYLFLVPPQ